MPIPENVAEITFLFSGDLKEGVGYSDIENVLWSAGFAIGVDDHLSWSIDGYAMLYINYTPGRGSETDLFQIDKDMQEALKKAEVWA